MPAKIVHLELSEPIPSIPGTERYDHVLILTRYRGRVVGKVWLPTGRAPVVPAARVREQIVAEQNWALSDFLIKDRLTPEWPRIDRPPISVVVASAGRPAALAVCLDRMAALEYPGADVLVVDGSRNRDSARRVAEQYGARFLEADAPGLAAARNRGIEATTADIIAFTVDLASPDPGWLDSIAGAIRDPAVSIVTGLVTPAELETDPQFFAEVEYGRWLDTETQAIRGAWLSRPQLLWTYRYGSGANLAVRRSALEAVGGFAADSGDETGWDASDSDLLRRLLHRGAELRYEPAAIVTIVHPRDDAELRRVVRIGASSHGAMAIRAWRSGELGFRELMWFFLHCLVKRPIRRWLEPSKAPRRLIGSELLGVLTSPAGYWKRRARLPVRTLAPAVRSGAPVAGIAPAEASGPGESAGLDSTPRRVPGAATILVVRTRYAHWGRYSGFNQFLRFLAPERFTPVEHLVPETDVDFPIKSGTIRDWLRHRIQRDGMPWYGLNDLWGELTTIRAYWGFHRPSVIHYLDGEHSAQYLPRLSGKRRRPATVATFHQPADVLAKVIRRDVVRRFDRIAAVAEDQAEFLAGLASPDRVVVTPHGIDSDFFSPGPSTRDELAPFRCLSVGHNYRDYAAVRETARLLRDRPIEFHVVSPRPTGLEGLPNARSYRSLPDEALRQLYRDCDLLLLPLTKVTANNAVLEAMGCGLPIVSTDLPAMRLYVDAASALLTPGNQAGDLADLVELLRRDERKRAAMSRAARARALELDWRRIAPLYEEIYRTIG